MKKCLLSVLAMLSGLFAVNAADSVSYVKALTVSDPAQLVSGKYLIGVYNRGTSGYLSYSSDASFILKNTTEDTDGPVPETSSLLWDVTVTEAEDGHKYFTINHGDERLSTRGWVAAGDNTARGQYIYRLSESGDNSTEAQFRLDEDNIISPDGTGDNAQPAGVTEPLWRVAIDNATFQNSGATSYWVMQNNGGRLGYWSGVGLVGGETMYAGFTFYRMLKPYETAELHEGVFTPGGSGRYTGNIVVANGEINEPCTIAGLQTNGDAGNAENGNYLFYDKSENVILAYAGSAISTSNTVGSGTGGMQKQIYVDWNCDGYFGPNPYTGLSDFIQTGADNGSIKRGDIINNELVTYWRISDNGTWVGPNGVTGNQSQTYNLGLSFTVPAETQPGEYRSRYKYAWNSMDPYATVLSGGIVVDFTIKVVTFEQMYSLLVDRILEEHGITGYEYTVPQGMASHQDVLDRVAEFDIPFDLEGLNGRNVLIGNVAGAGVIDQVDGSLRPAAGNAPLTAAWTVAVADNKIAFTNAVNGLKLNNLSVSEAEATQWTVTPVSLGSSQVTIANAEGSKLTVVDGELTLAADGGDNVWTVTEVSADDLSRWHTAANTATEAYAGSHTLGNEPGKYVVSGVSAEEFASVRAARSAFNDAYAEGNFDYAAAASLAAAEPAQLSLFDLNALSAPALVTLSYSGWSTHNQVVASNVEFGGNQMLTTGDAASVFVLDNGCLYGLENGRGIIAGTNAPYVHNDDEDYSTNEATTLTFGEVSNMEASGRYYIKAGESKTFGATSGSSVYRIPFDNISGVPQSNYGYYITYVEELTVACDGDKVYRLPVAAELSRVDDDVRVFVVEVSGDEITTTQVSVGAAASVYPAGTCFMMRGNGNIVFAAHNGETAEGTYANSVAGHHKAHSYTAPENMVGLVLKDSAAEPEQPEVPVEMPVRRAAGAESETMAMVAVSASDKMEAHNAILEVPVAGNMMEGATANVILGGKISTAITEILMDADGGNAAVYDLQGRRLAAPVKGINIIGGRKVLVR